jgi:hypothetical protein
VRRTHRLIGAVAPRAVRRILNGLGPQPGWLPRRWLTVVSGDVDPEAGVGALWLVWRPRAATAETHTVLVERCGEEWRYTGGGSGPGTHLPAARPMSSGTGPDSVIECVATGGTLSYAHRLLRPTRPDVVGNVPWVGYDELRVAAGVDHLLLGERRIAVPENGSLIVVWTSRSTRHGGVRPPLVALGHDGSDARARTRG